MKRLDECIKAIVCALVFLVTIFLLFDPAALQDQWKKIMKRLRCLFVLSFKCSVVALII